MKKRYNKMKKEIILIIQNIMQKWNTFINKKYPKLLFKFLPQNIFLFLLFLLSIGTIIHFNQNILGTVLYSQPIMNDNIGPILTEAVEFKLNNIETEANPDNICFTFATYGRKTNSKYKYEIYHNESLIYEKKFNSKILNDGKVQCFPLKEMKKETMKEYTIKIVPIYTDSDNAITIFKNNETNEPSMFITKNIPLNSGRNLVLMLFIILFFIGNYIINKKEIKPEKFWLIISITYLFWITFIYPPYQIPDEPVHFYSSYRMTQIDKNKTLYENIKNGEIITPSNIECLNYSDIERTNKVSNYEEMWNCFKNTENKVDKTYEKYNYVSSRTGYFASSIGIKIADIFTNSPLIIFYSGRMINTILSIIIIFLAIKIIPKYKELLLVVATIPMFIQQQSSYSYDIFINASTFLSIAIIVKMMYSSKIKWVLYSIILLVCGIFITEIKMIYLPIMLLLLFIPDEKFKRKKYKYLYCCSLILGMLLGGKLIGMVFNNGTLPNVIGNSENMQRILEQPSLIFSIAFNTIQKNGLFYLRSLVGYFGWFSFKLSDLYIYAYVICFIYLIRHNNIIKEKKINTWICIGSILLSIAAVFASMYFSWSEAGLDYVDGVQGRYFMPLLVPILLLCMSKKEKKEMEIKNIYTFINIIVVQYILTLLVAFY